MKVVYDIIKGLGAAMLLLALLACEKPLLSEVAPAHDEEENGQQTTDTQMPDQIQITIAGKMLIVKIENNSATQALVGALREASITYTASDYGGFEKVGALGRSLPTSDTRITTQPGDVILYSGAQIVLFYGSNTWSYTRLGRIQYSSTEELKSFLKAGEGDVSVTLSL